MAPPDYMLCLPDGGGTGGAPAPLRTETGSDTSAILPLSQDMIYTVIVLVCMETKAIECFLA